MKRHRKSGLAAAALIVLGAAACFDDPTSSLREGPAALALNRTSVTVRYGDSTAVEAILRDAQGNPLSPTGITWSTADPTIAVVNVDEARPIPGQAYARAFVRGVSAIGGITTVTVTTQGQSASFRVLVLPATFTGATSVVGTAVADTIVTNTPSGPVSSFITAGETLTVQVPATYVFDPAASGVFFGPNSAYIISRDSFTIKAMARYPYAGKARITNLRFRGNSETGVVDIASLETDSIAIARARFRGTVAVAASAFGPNTQMTVTAPAGVSFSSSSQVRLGSTTAIRLSQSATQLVVISATAYTGTIMVTNATVGTGTIDSLRSMASSTINASFFPGTVTNGAGNYLDTIVVRCNGLCTFRTATTAPGPSQVTVNGAQAFLVQRTADSMKVIASRPGTGPVTVSNVIVSGTTIPSLSTSGTITVSTTPGDPTEPANNTPGGTTITLTGTTSANPLVIYGTIDDGTGAGDVDDFYTFSSVAGDTVVIQLTFAGTGAGGATNPDIDLLACNAACNAFVGGFGGATAGNPENLTLNFPPLADGTYHIYVNGWDTGGLTYSYRLSVYIR
ncbi:MAG TPA: hypothetical protein VNL98_13900 [Gemmatimonadales bacterium]|nr:hypothetical protein [Gemmatimonadales bacterium]